MLITALSPFIGYDKCAQIAKYAYKHHTTLKQAALQLNVLSEAEFDQYMNPETMIKPKKFEDENQ